MAIFVVTTAVADASGSVWSTRAGPRHGHEGIGSFLVPPRSCPGVGCRCVDGGPLQVIAEVEVRGESVPQILGGEVAQRCPGHGSCERGDIVSLIIGSLQQLRQRWPVSLSEESLVEVAGQGRPPLLRPDRGCFGQTFLDLAHAVQGIGSGPPRVEVPLRHIGEQGLPHRRQGKVEAGADGVAALVPTFWGRAATTRAASSRA
jgi:hypothetical protein